MLPLCYVGIVVMYRNARTDISLTYHKTTDQLKCHYCGYQETPPNICPNCEGDHIRQVGTGTQRVEELLQQEFPESRIIRMDVDTTSRKGAHEKLLNEFEAETEIFY